MSESAGHGRNGGQPPPRRTVAERAAIVERVLTAMCEGRSVREMARKFRVPRSRLMEWLSAEAYRDQYARAREEQGRALAEEALDLARRATPESANAVRVTVDTLKWAAARMAPRDYGDRHQHELRGALGTIDYSRLTDEQIERMRAGENVLQVLGSTAPRALLSKGDTGDADAS